MEVVRVDFSSHTPARKISRITFSANSIGNSAVRNSSRTTAGSSNRQVAMKNPVNPGTCGAGRGGFVGEGTNGQ